MTQFTLSVYSRVLPKIPDVPDDIEPATIHSSLVSLPESIQCKSPMFLTLLLPSARDKRPLFPATHLQLSYEYENTGSVFLPHSYLPQDLVKSDDEAEENLWVLEVKPEHILRAKVGQGNTTTATIRIHAWRNEKLLGQFDGGSIPDLGLAGFKSHPVALLRQATWEAAKAAKAEKAAKN